MGQRTLRPLNAEVGTREDLPPAAVAYGRGMRASGQPFARGTARRRSGSRPLAPPPPREPAWWAGLWLRSSRSPSRPSRYRCPANTGCSASPTPRFSPPSDGRNLTDWPGSLGSNKRTLTQLFSTQAGMSFRASHQQWRLHRSVEQLAAGQSITVISREVGYESPSAIIAMFQRYLATTPSRFLAK